MEKITLLKGLYCTPSCDGRIEGEIRKNSIFVLLQGTKYRLDLKKILSGERENRGGWIFEKAENYTEEELKKREKQAEDWLD